ncbi:hypothetical protein LR48_Vigan707s003600 [Vigna angularis]|uniref:Uncharacterized protein n=2 Tax=Phaseolus angularis TaxID=3914 RepID=A0A0L9TH91_PHAAN|nr:hypothetical protein LR48_Vigan707s003600 [Vigna angularis]BAT98025.1 hypothetical protein VIGAN_09163000 [Vigna angularis var. angularis]
MSPFAARALRTTFSIFSCADLASTEPGAMIIFELGQRSSPVVSKTVGDVTHGRSDPLFAAVQTLHSPSPHGPNPSVESSLLLPQPTKAIASSVRGIESSVRGE